MSPDNRGPGNDSLHNSLSASERSALVYYKRNIYISARFFVRFAFIVLHCPTGVSWFCQAYLADNTKSLRRKSR